MATTCTFQRLRRRAGFLAGCALTLFVASISFAQDGPKPTIESVEFSGLNRISRVFAEDIAKVRPGDPLDESFLDKAEERLIRTGRFISVKHAVEMTETGARVRFDCRERPTVTAIRFEGSKKYRFGQLKENVPLKIGDSVDLFAIRDGRDAILARYREEGYRNVKVTYNETKLQESGELVFTIVEGERTRIRKIDFEGRSAFSKWELGRKLRSKTAIWIFRSGAFEAETAEGDVARVQGFYRDEGYLDAIVGYRVEPHKNPHDLRMVFKIEEGVRYSIESIDFTGATVLSREELFALVGSKVGDFAKQPKIDADAKAIQTLYGELGYIDARVRPVRIFSNTPALVRVTFEITQGEQYRVGDVVVRGNARTKDKVVRRALNLYPPDDLFNLTEAKEAEKRLRETRIFSAARVVPVGDKPGVRDAVIDVTESEKTGDFLFGFGITSNNGAVGQIVLDLQNFDIADKPKSWKEFVRFRSFFGAGQRMRIELQPGTRVTRARVEFTEPYLFDRPLRFDTSVYLFQRGRDGYTEERIGGNVSLGKRFERGLLQGWSGEIALRSELVEVDDVDLLASRQIKKDEGDNLLTGVKGTLVRDRTDNRLNPSNGDRYRASYEQFGLIGGDHQFGKWTTSYSWYKTLHVDEQDRKGVLELRIESGQIVGNAPVFERFYAGGVGSIRGFEFRGVGPRDGLQDNNIGGDTMLLMGAEYSFPLYTELVRGLLFVDTGTVDYEQLRASIGTGVRLTLDILGPLPIELAIAAPLLKDDEDEEQVFSFAIGSMH